MCSKIPLIYWMTLVDRLNHGFIIILFPQILSAAHKLSMASKWFRNKKENTENKMKVSSFIIFSYCKFMSTLRKFCTEKIIDAIFNILANFKVLPKV